MVRWFVRFAGSVALVGGVLTVPAALSITTPASADTVVNGCMIVSNPPCQVLDANNDVATGTFVVTVAPVTQVVVPSGGAVLAGAPYLDATASDAAGVKSVVFEVSGGALNNQVVATAKPTLYGWIGQWATTGVPNGTYSLQSVATDTAANSFTSAPITVTVNNPPPSTAVLVPSAGASVSGTKTVLDASASANVTSVSYELNGGTLSNQVIATGTPTLYGWLAQWNTTSVPNGTYTLQSVASYSGGVSGTSAPITITVKNAPPTTTVVLPSNNASVSGYQYLDATASPGVTQVTYELSGGPANLSDAVIATGTPTLYGWLADWNSTGVANGTYTLQSVASYGGGVSGTSAPISVTVAPIGLAALDSNIAGTLTGFNISVTNGNSNAAGAAGTETLQTNVVLQSASVVSCALGPFNLCELATVSGTFSITTSLGTLSGTASGSFGGPLISESPPQAPLSAGEYTLTVTAATGALTSTVGGTLNVSLQFSSGSNDFTGTVTG